MTANNQTINRNSAIMPSILTFVISAFSAPKGEDYALRRAVLIT